MYTFIFSFFLIREVKHRINKSCLSTTNITKHVQNTVLNPQIPEKQKKKKKLIKNKKKKKKKKIIKNINKKIT
jgi:signal recognition particle subunit SEC65